jgi:enoyl-CoA hydratase/carnithine racemase
VHDPVLDKAREVAALLSAKSPIALRLMKALANRALGGDHAQLLERAIVIGDSADPPLPLVSHRVTVRGVEQLA